jgi:hypothetical protein
VKMPENGKSENRLKYKKRRIKKNKLNYIVHMKLNFNFTLKISYYLLRVVGASGWTCKMSTSKKAYFSLRPQNKM